MNIENTEEQWNFHMSASRSLVSSVSYVKPMVPKLGVNYPSGVIFYSAVGNAEPKSQC